MPADRDGTGAMMEHYYEKFCLPIFPMSNNYTCSFVSLGQQSLFLCVYDDRPPNTAAMLPVLAEEPSAATRFSSKHLPYSPVDSAPRRWHGAGLFDDAGRHFCSATRFYKESAAGQP